MSLVQKIRDVLALTPEETEKSEKTFDNMDKDGSGTVDVDEIWNAKFREMYDQDGDKKVTKAEYMSIQAKKKVIKKCDSSAYDLGGIENLVDPADFSRLLKCELEIMEFTERELEELLISFRSKPLSAEERGVDAKVFLLRLQAMYMEPKDITLPATTELLQRFKTKFANEKEIEQRKVVFKNIDKDNNGQIDVNDYKDVPESLREMVFQFFSKNLDANDDKCVTLSEYIRMTQVLGMASAMGINLNEDRPQYLDEEKILSKFHLTGFPFAVSAVKEIYSKMPAHERAVSHTDFTKGMVRIATTH